MEHELADEDRDNELPPPLTFDAKTDTLRWTCVLPHLGHFTSTTAAVERNNSSNG